MTSFKNKTTALFMWVLPLTFFAYQFILRLWPGLSMQQIMGQFSIDASYFGMLAAFYYYGYSGMQIPVAILLDRFGARRIIPLFAIICGASTLLFTYTDNFYLALLSRFLIGAGSAVGFLGISKVVSEWFPKEQYAKMIGFSFTFGLMGAIYGGKPTTLLIEQYGWQNVSLFLGTTSIVIAIALYLVLRSPTKEQVIVQQEELKLSNLKSTLTSPLIWLLAIANLLMVGSLEGFADVWGVPYLMTSYNFAKSDAAGLISFIFFGMLFGGPLLALLSKKFGNYPIIACCGVGMAFAFLILLNSSIYNPIMLSCLFFTVGVMCCYQVLVFAAGSELVSTATLGITIAFLNSINMLGGSFFHTLVGNTMDFFFNGAIDEHGVRVYDLTAYQYALSVIPLCSLVGVIIILGVWIKANKISYLLCSKA